MKAQLIKKFEDELMTLDKELKTELPQEIRRARELGDLRENAEYHAAKERQRLVEAKISLLKKRISDIHMMNIDRIPHDKVGFGSTVHLKDDATAGTARRRPLDIRTPSSAAEAAVPCAMRNGQASSFARPSTGFAFIAWKNQELTG